MKKDGYYDETKQFDLKGDKFQRIIDDEKLKEGSLWGVAPGCSADMTKLYGPDAPTNTKYPDDPDYRKRDERGFLQGLDFDYVKEKYVVIMRWKDGTLHGRESIIFLDANII